VFIRHSAQDALQRHTRRGQVIHFEANAWRLRKVNLHFAIKQTFHLASNMPTIKNALYSEIFAGDHQRWSYFFQLFCTNFSAIVSCVFEIKNANIRTLPISLQHTTSPTHCLLPITFTHGQSRHKPRTIRPLPPPRNICPTDAKTTSNGLTATVILEWTSAWKASTDVVHRTTDLLSWLWRSFPNQPYTCIHEWLGAAGVG